jgi:hypothetical protein
MNKKFKTGIGFLLCLSCFLTSALAHHSPVVFDRTKDVKLMGVVKEFKWTNPHSWIELNVRNEKGELEAWAVELTSPNQLVKAGWKSTIVKSGDEVSVVVHPLKSGEKVGQFVSITLPNGKILSDRAN